MEAVHVAPMVRKRLHGRSLQPFDAHLFFVQAVNLTFDGLLCRVIFSLSDPEKVIWAQVCTTKG